MPLDVPDEVKAEFSEWLDRYAAAWEEQARAEFGKGEESGGVAPRSLATTVPGLPAAPVAEPDPPPAPPPPAKRPGGLRRAFRRLAAVIKGRPAPQVTVTPARPEYKVVHVRDQAGNIIELRRVRVDGGGSDDAATPAAT